MANSWNKTRDLQNALAEVNKLSVGGSNNARAVQNQTSGASNSRVTSVRPRLAQLLEFYLHLKNIGESMAIIRYHPQQLQKENVRRVILEQLKDQS